MGILSKLFGKKERIESQPQTQPPPEKLFAIVELKSPHLLAFDLPSEGVKYKIPDFEPGIYQIPLEAVQKATDPDSPPGSCIEVDTGVIYFIDADFETAFRDFESQLFEETGDSYNLTENPDVYTKKIGIKFDCLIAPGIESGYEFEGDGAYNIDLSKVAKK